MVKVKVYTSHTCPYCDMAKDFLRQNRVKFTEIDVSSPKAREKVIELTGQVGVPVIDIDGKIVIGFEKQELKKLLKIK